MFPPGYFYILSRKHGYALDVYDGQTKPDANIIVWPQKFQDSDNQLWTYDQGRLVNKKSGLVLDIRQSAFKKDKAIIQNKPKETHQTQEWGYDNGFIYSMLYPSMVLDIKGDSAEGGAQVLLYKRKECDNLNQQWYLEPYERFQASLNMAATEGPLHKKPGFGQPRLGYGAEVGVPPELKKLPDDIKVVGVKGDVPATPSAPIPTTGIINNNNNSQLPEALAAGNYPGGYQPGSATQTGPSPQPAYPPQSSYPPPQRSPVNYQQASAYPPPPTTSSSSTPAYPPPPPVSRPGGYPPMPSASSSYPPPKYPDSSDYPPPPSTSGYNYPPPSSSSSSHSSYPPAQLSYPPSQPPRPSDMYPPPPSGSPPGPGGFYPPPAAGGFYPPPQTSMPSPHQGGYPPPPPSGGYPSYPQ